MTSGDPCPKCREEVSLVDPNEEIWGLDPSDYDDEAMVWLCVACNWSEEAELDEVVAESAANLEWTLARLDGSVD